MAVIRSSHAVRDQRAPMHVLERDGERERGERARQQYLETLSRRLSQRAGMPIARAREYVASVAITARKSQDPPTFIGWQASRLPQMRRNKATQSRRTRRR